MTADVKSDQEPRHRKSFFRKYFLEGKFCVDAFHHLLRYYLLT
ncbi:unnamed protein product [Heligmosomoides polygyrus]|uniref:RGS domain-containing protein n=1 Tax=Heligmosomoides polygyrus TaxID=6339 RepID=A0A183GMW1_HELPZ|nr:unnamed protein product [Heligmosomoides polygyrus]